MPSLSCCFLSGLRPGFRRSVGSGLSSRGPSVLALLALFAVSAAAQNADLSGFVKDAGGGVIPGATISVQQVSTEVRTQTTTNAAGLYLFSSLQPGVYRVTAEADGFEKQVIEDLTLDVGAKMTRNISLAVGSVSETVTVTDSGLDVNTVNGAVSTVVDRQFVENIPLNGRSFQSLLTMTPGVLAVPSSGTGFSGELSVNGQRTEANYYMIDGVSANTGALTINNSSGVGRGSGFSGSTPMQSAIGTTQSLVSVDALQEFRATTSTYSAEFGRTPGGQFQFVTRSGTNQLHGSAFEYFRNDKLDANNWFNNQTGLPRQAERQNDFGGTLGGPVWIPGLYKGKDRTFFFFSYEGLRLRNPQASRTFDVPSLELRQSAPPELHSLLNGFPLPNGPATGVDGLSSFTASYSAPSDLDATSFRLDHSFTDSFKVFGRFNYSPSSTSSRQLPNLANVSSVSIDVTTLTLGATNILNPRVSNEFRYNSTWNNSLGSFTPDDFGGATPFEINDLPGLQDPNANLFFYLNFGLRPVMRIIPRDIDQTQFNFTDTLTASVGRHMLRFGVDYRRVGNTHPLPSVYEYPVFSNANQVRANQPQFVTLFRFSSASAAPVYTNFSSFVQDEWRVNSRLSVSLGLRWDVNPAPGDAKGNLPYNLDQVDDLVTAKLSPQGTPLWKTRYLNLAPRFGFAYQLRQSSRYLTVLRGGAGLFYDTGNNLASMGYWGVGTASSQTLTGIAAPATQAQIDATPGPSTATPYENTVYAYDPKLKLPYTTQWNFSIEQGLGGRQTLTVSYVGAAGRRLLLQRRYVPGYLGNENFKSNDQFGNTAYITTNGSDSDYHALQTRFQRRLSHGLQLLASYTWSHSIDTASTNFDVEQLLRGSSDFDIRHNFQLAATYDLPRLQSGGVAKAIVNGFAVDARLSARSAMPVDLIGRRAVSPDSGSSFPYAPNLVPGQPLYIDDASAPGGRRINFDAFEAAPEGVYGNAGRNPVRGFSAFQTDLALRRHFRLSERLGLQLRAEAFNVFNTPIFGAIYNDLGYGASRFGYAYSTQNSQLGGLSSIYQTGGPRSIQLSLRLRF
ncbi:MAG: TonB-dependent receptor plug domain-containing protein [Acidobacteria bacterium]|nr:TonB-dependent receptor plug domain-containing protein [Acidobacteriota bacterium]